MHLCARGILVRDNDEWVDLKVCELAVNIDSIQTADEVDQDVVYALGHLLQQCLGKDLIRGVLLEVNGNEQLFSLSIDITDVDTTFVSEQNPVALVIVSFVPIISLNRKMQSAKCVPLARS